MISVHTKTDPRCGALVISLIGEAGMGSIAELESSLAKAAAAKPALVIFDLAGLTFLSSLGIGAFVTFHRSVVRGGGHVILGGPRATVMAAMEYARLDKFFEIYRSVEEAVREAIATGRSHDCEAGAH